MASRKTISVEGLAGLAVEIIGVALSHVKGVPGLVWTLLLIFGGCLLLLAVVQWFWRGGTRDDGEDKRTVGYRGRGGSAIFEDSEIEADDAVINDGGRLRFLRSRIGGKPGGEKRQRE